MPDEHIRPPIGRVSPAGIQAGHPNGEAPAVATMPAEMAAPTETKDTFREVVETVVFVIVLVLLLKTFVAEAFVIPTGSMATTLLGYHKDETCPQCNYRFTVNASIEQGDKNTPPHAVERCTCPNCGYVIDLRKR